MGQGRVPDLPEGCGPDLPGLEGEARLHRRVLRPGCKLRLGEEVIGLTVLVALFQKDADQIYPGWKEKLGYTGCRQLRLAEEVAELRVEQLSFVMQRAVFIASLVNDKAPH